MSLIKNIQKGSFWVNVVKVGTPFLVVVALFSLLFKTGDAIFSGTLKLFIMCILQINNGFVFG